jgi:hypothetical protein
VLSLFAGPGVVAPIPKAPGGRRPRVSDGFHEAGGKARGGKGHRGTDWMYRRVFPWLWSMATVHPWGSRWHFMLPAIPVVAILPGRVVSAGKLATGWHVRIDHGQGHDSTYHHLASVLESIEPGVHVGAGQPVGVVGGSPIGYGLVHLHLDCRINGKYVDPGAWIPRWKVLSFDEAWNGVGRVGTEDLAAA